MNSFGDLAQLTHGQVAVLAGLDPLDGQRSNPMAAKLDDVDVGRLHDPPDGVIEPLMDHEPDPDSLAGLAEQPDLIRDHVPVVDPNAIAKVLECPVGRPLIGQDVVFLGELVAGVHDAVGQFPVIRQEEQPFGVPIQPTDRIQALLRLDEVHDRPPLAVVLHGRDVTGRLVQQHRPEPLRAGDLAVDLNLVGYRVDPGAEFGHNDAIDEDAATGDEFFRRTA